MKVNVYLIEKQEFAFLYLYVYGYISSNDNKVMGRIITG